MQRSSYWNLKFFVFWPFYPFFIVALSRLGVVGMVDTVFDEFGSVLNEILVLKILRGISLTSVNISWSEHQMAILTILLDSKCQVWASSGVGLGSELLFFIQSFVRKLV